MESPEIYWIAAIASVWLVGFGISDQLRKLHEKEMSARFRHYDGMTAALSRIEQRLHNLDEQLNALPWRTREALEARPLWETIGEALAGKHAPSDQSG